MPELEDQIARLLLRSTQLLIHLQRLPSGSPAAAETRVNLASIMEKLVRLNGKRDRLLSELEPAG